MDQKKQNLCATFDPNQEHCGKEHWKAKVNSITKFLTQNSIIRNLRILKMYYETKAFNYLELKVLESF